MRFLLPFYSVHSFSAKDIAAAMKLAVDFTVASIKATVGDSGHRYGVKFEKALPGLMRSLES